MIQREDFDGLPEPPKDADALSEAAMKLAEYGIEIRLPWNCSLDDPERNQYDGFVAACRAYAAMAPQNWQPISTAPKDRELLLAGQWNLTGNWDIQIGQWLINRFPFIADGPHYWMPLPPHPRKQQI